ASGEGNIHVAAFKKPNLIFACLNRACAVWLISGLAVFAHASSSDIVLYAAKAPVRKGTWAVVADSTAAGGKAIANPNLGVPKLAAPLAKPANYFELTLPAYSAKAYHLWISGKAAGNSTNNDSVYVQFSDSVNSAGSAIHRYVRTSETPSMLRACNTAIDNSL